MAGRLTTLCGISHAACNALAPMVFGFYKAIDTNTAKAKADASIFTIADGIVQYLLVNHLYGGDKFAAVVGEEDENNVNILTAPYTVDDLTVPEQFFPTIDAARLALDDLSKQIGSSEYKDLTIFIDPIDGTREFSTGLGEQCSICIGFNDPAGSPVAGIVYRPITQPPTFAMGARSEGLAVSQLFPLPEGGAHRRGFLTSNGGISPFIEQLIAKLGFERVPSGGAGNKMLMLLEGRGALYLQDRGVSRWDTSGAQAVLEAHGGALAQLAPFAAGETELRSYKYLKSTVNLDFLPATSCLTPYNARDKTCIKKGDPPRQGILEEFQPYSNLLGLLAVSAEGLQPGLLELQQAVLEVANNAPPAYD